MTFDEFLKAMNRTKLDDQAIERLRQDMRRVEEEFDELDRERAITTEVLARTCSL